jgi:hypothetical protein
MNYVSLQVCHCYLPFLVTFFPHTVYRLFPLISHSNFNKYYKARRICSYFSMASPQHKTSKYESSCKYLNKQLRTADKGILISLRSYAESKKYCPFNLLCYEVIRVSELHWFCGINYAVGRPSCRWEDYIKMELSEIGSKDGNWPEQVPLMGFCDCGVWKFELHIKRKSLCQPVTIICIIQTL